MKRKEGAKEKKEEGMGGSEEANTGKGGGEGIAWNLDVQRFIPTNTFRHYILSHFQSNTIYLTLRNMNVQLRHSVPPVQYI